ncbi:MAG: hypothetical protein AB7S88_00825 [Candidatus Izemoplasmatales bacterium]
MTNILDTINGFVEDYITQLLDLFDTFQPWIQALILLGIAIFVIIGLFVFLKKFIKLFLVLAILGAIGYFLYSGGYLDSVLGGFAALLG